MNKHIGTAALYFSLVIGLGGCETQESTPPTQSDLLYEVWGADAQNIWAVGTNGVILRKNGSTWVKEATGTTQHLTALWGVDKNNLYAVGHQGTIVHYDGTTWSPSTVDPNQLLCTKEKVATPGVNLFGIWGSSANDIWVVGDCGALLHYNGQNWTRSVATVLKDPKDPKDPTKPIVEPLIGVWGTNANNVWAVGWNETILYWNGIAWGVERWPWNSEVNATAVERKKLELADRCRLQPGEANPTLPVHLYRLWGSSMNDVFAVGSCGTIINRNPVDGTWEIQKNTQGEPIKRTTKSGLNAVFGNGTKAWAVGDGGTLLSRSGTTWSMRDSGTKIDLSGVWMDGVSSLWMVGYDDIVRQISAP